METQEAAGLERRERIDRLVVKEQLVGLSEQEGIELLHLIYCACEVVGHPWAMNEATRQVAEGAGE